jgi:hypothetical protein
MTQMLRKERLDHTSLLPTVLKFCLHARSTHPPSVLGISTVHLCTSRSRPPFLPSIHTFDSAIHVHPSLSSSSFNPLGFAFQSSHFASQLTYQKCLPKPQRRSPPLVARPQLVRHQPIRKKLARRLPPLHQARRRSEARPGRRPTPATSTKVQLSLARRIEPRAPEISSSCASRFNPSE